MKKNNYIAYLEDFGEFSLLYRQNDDMQWDAVKASGLAKEDSVINVLLSAKVVTVLTLNPPPNYEKYGQQLLLNLVENHIVEPIEQIELLPIEKQKKQLVVAVINKEKWQSLTSQMKKNGWELGKVWIDALCLPTEKNTGCLFAISSQQVLWHSHNNQVFSGDLSVLEQTQDYQNSLLKWITIQPTEISDNDYPNNAVKEILSLTQTTKHNLNPQVTTDKKIKKYKMPIIILAIVALFLWTVNLYLSNRHNKKLADNYYQSSVELFRQVFPKAKKIPTRSYLTQKLKTLAGTNNRNGSQWKNWLELIAQHINAKQIELLSIDYSEQPTRMIIEVQASNSESIQAVINQLSGAVTVKEINNTQNSTGHNNMTKTTLEIKE